MGVFFLVYNGVIEAPELCLPTAGQTSGSVKTPDGCGRTPQQPIAASLPGILPANQGAVQNIQEGPVSQERDRVGQGEKESGQNKSFKTLN